MHAGGGIAVARHPFMRPTPTASHGAEPTVVFHDRHTMEEAVHALVDAGVSARHIRIAQAVEKSGHVEPAPELGRAVVTGLVLGAIIGGTTAVLWLLAVVRATAHAGAFVELSWPWLVLRAIGGTASGAILGALFALVIRALARGDESAAVRPTGDFVVSVKTPSERAGADVRDLLVFRGGDPLPA